MSTQTWLPTDGEFLKKLREEACVDVTAIARENNLSINQINQLENGGDSSFYSPTIKLAAGRRLLLYFGADLVSNPKSPGPISKQGVVLESHSQKKLVQYYETNSNFLIKPKRIFPFSGLFFLAVLAGLVVASVYFPWLRIDMELNFATNQPTHTSTDLLPLVKSMPAITSLSAASETTSNNFVESTRCSWMGDSIPLSGHKPTKQGDYVYLIAKTDAVICVRDSQNKVHVLQMKNMQAQTIRGQPPFEISSITLDQFQVFFQGNLLRMPKNHVTKIILNEQKHTELVE